MEIGEHVQLGRQRRALVHILAVAAGPEKRLALGVLQAREINLAAAKNGFVLGGEILADDGDQPDGREMAGGQSKIAGGAAEGAVNLSVRGFNAIERDRPHDQKRHDLSQFLAGRVMQFCVLVKSRRHLRNVLSDDWCEALLCRRRNHLAVRDDGVGERRAALAPALAAQRTHRFANRALHVFRIAPHVGEDFIRA